MDTGNPRRISGGYIELEYSEVSVGDELQVPHPPTPAPGGNGSRFLERSWGGGVGPGKAATRELFEPGLQTRHQPSPCGRQGILSFQEPNSLIGKK